MKRQGLNSEISYVRYGTRRVFRLRTRGITYALNQVAEVSQGRVSKAVYPHRLSQAPFAIQVDLKGHEEYRQFNNWLAEYARYALTITADSGSMPEMTVSVPKRNFSRRGIPQGPIEWGDHLGSMLWSPVITFETTYEPGDAATKKSGVSAGDASGAFDPESRYFYPTSVQLNGSEAPTGTYARVLGEKDLQALVSGGQFTSADGSWDKGSTIDEVYPAIGVEYKTNSQGTVE
jgi:hypothetical protein